MGVCMFAATFGKVHIFYKPGNVKLKPKILRECQFDLTGKHGAEASLDLDFHSGSGSSPKEIYETLN